MAEVGSEVGKQLGKVVAGAIDEIAGSLDKHGASAWLATVGFVMIGYALTSQEGSWSHLRSGEFIAVLLAGVIFILVAVGYRLYVRVQADRIIHAALGQKQEQLTEL